ncbi:Uncharacterised protein [uncultured archaeon]|nr:Uncharacterised protein [uncultured archaeon]
MRLNFKKVTAIAASALMVGLTMGTAVAANYPAPFVAGGAANVAVVYGTGSGVSSLDLVQAGNIQSNLQSYMTGTSGSTTVTGGDAWQVGTSSDILEINESIAEVTSYISSGDLAILADGSLSNEKGDSTYKQYLYFETTDLSDPGRVIYTSDPDTDALGLFFKIPSGQQIAKYVMSFGTALGSDIDTADNKLSDIEDKQITLLGKTYTITSAYMTSKGVDLTLMSGALTGTARATPLTIGEYTVSAEVTSATEAKFTITSASGTETTAKMDKGDIEKLANGKYLAVTDITYQGIAGADNNAVFYIGADKLELNNNSAMVVNGETVSDAHVDITASNVSDVSISQIAINMTAEDDLYVPVGKKLSQASDLDKPEVLVGQNWDISFAGLKAQSYENISFKVSGNDKKYTLDFVNYNGDKVELPVLYTNTSGVYGGADADKSLVLLSTFQNVSKNDYVILNTGNPKVPTSNAKTVVIQYKGADKTTDTNPVFHFTLNPGSNQVDRDVVMTTAAGSMGHGTLQEAGADFTFINASSCSSANDCLIAFSSGDYGSKESTTDLSNASVSNYIRTYYNTLINITDKNATFVNEIIDPTNTVGTSSVSDPWSLNVTIDDTTRDDDQFTLPNQGAVFYVNVTNSSGDAKVTQAGTSKWLTSPDDSNVQEYIGLYGQHIISTDPADSPVSIEASIPKSIANPLVYINSGDISVSSTTGGATQLGDVLVKDSEVSSVSSKNLIVVGGSCINSVAANLLGSTCGSDFTTKTDIGSGQFLIQSLASTYSTGKVALVVAGYEAADTVNAATYLRTQTVDTTVGKKYKGTSATTATLVVA